MNSRLQIVFTAALVPVVSLFVTGCSQRVETSRENAELQEDVVVGWHQAAGHIGEYATVEGPVVNTKYAASTRRKPTFLNIGKAYPQPGRFTVVVWGSNRDSFRIPPEEQYRGKTVQVSGTIESYKGTPQIVVSDPSSIRVVDPRTDNAVVSR